MDTENTLTLDQKLDKLKQITAELKEIKITYHEIVSMQNGTTSEV